jgi:hypothetical protein
MTDAEKVQDAVKKIRALRQVAKDTCISTTRSQSFVLRALPDHLLVEVSVLLQNEKTGQELTNGNLVSNPRQK